MATPTLDEIEERARDGGYERMDRAFLGDMLAALVAHVRALEKRHTDEHVLEARINALDERANNMANHVFGPRAGGPGLIDETADLYADMEKHASRIAALEAKVAAREQEMDRLRVVLPQRDDMAFEQCARLFERVAALEKRARPVTVGVSAPPPPRNVEPEFVAMVHEMDRLRAENAELRKAVTELGLRSGSASMVQDAVETSLKMRVENADLRKRVESIGAAAAALDSALRDAERLCPAPQPIETAPLERILTWCADDVPDAEWLSESPDDHTLEEWRAMLKKWGRTHWLPMPPPPGGGK